MSDETDYSGGRFAHIANPSNTNACKPPEGDDKDGGWLSKHVPFFSGGQSTAESTSNYEGLGEALDEYEASPASADSLTPPSHNQPTTADSPARTGNIQSSALRETHEEGALGRGSRRQFLRRAAAVGAAGTVLVGGSGAASAEQTEAKTQNPSRSNLPSYNEVVDYLLIIEHMEYALFRDALDSSEGHFDEAAIERSDVAKRFASDTLRYSMYQRFEQIRDQDRAHVRELASTISDSGGTPADEATYNFEYESVDEFVHLASRLKTVAVSGYSGVTPLLAEIEGAVITHRYLPVEARHAGYLRTLTEHSPYPSTFADQRTVSEVTSELQQYIDQ